MEKNTGEKIAKMLYDNLGSVYCYNCEYDDTENCDYCSRKSMGWALSKNAARSLAEEAMKIVRENEGDVW